MPSVQAGGVTLAGRERGHGQGPGQDQDEDHKVFTAEVVDGRLFIQYEMNEHKYNLRYTPLLSIP